MFGFLKRLRRRRESRPVSYMDVLNGALNTAAYDAVMRAIHAKMIEDFGPEYQPVVNAMTSEEREAWLVGAFPVFIFTEQGAERVGE